MEIQLGPEIIGSYKRLAYKHWYALAEFIDNSTQAYFDNKVALHHIFKENDDCLTVEINYGNDADGDFLIIKDNSIGMSLEELKNAVIVG